MRGTVAVVGAGNTGASWAGLFAAHGYAVRIFDQSQTAMSRALSRATAAAEFLAHKGLANPAVVQKGLSLIMPAGNLESAVDGVCLVQESVTDDLAVKRALFAEIGRLAPTSALIATSTSGLSITAIQEDTPAPGRTLAAHPYNPPHLIPLVELAPGVLTSPDTLDAAMKFYGGVGKEPVVISRDIPGYIANRLSAALWREAIELVRSGVATVEDIDRAVSLGPGLRWAIMGPHLVYHLGGGHGGIRGHLAHLTATKEGMLKDLASWTTLPGDTADILAAGVEAEARGRSLEELEAERDEALATIILALRQVKPGTLGDPAGLPGDAAVSQRGAAYSLRGGAGSSGDAVGPKERWA
ncbi:MAG: 3-hydroxyacyl-CoA dehydrogenase NAD-binding domain-containing protein [Chloroflexi bacterium]|nr:3-hydroxyacyl-CoA dehydrogenase NAD-binding domain-containing protein [Chloroflexota bacterium]MCL5735672.1 3-hydroxyacyl-CoA dehydrogenase NAD-binding domain-containing protein [Actinomycetota bacterium]